MSFEAMLGAIGKEVDEGLVAWRLNGVRGDEAARDRFYRELFLWARGAMRVAVAVKLGADPGLAADEAVAAIGDALLAAADAQADEAGFDGPERAHYLGIARDAASSLAEEYRARG